VHPVIPSRVDILFRPCLHHGLSYRGNADRSSKNNHAEKNKLP
jgi:hypothetical protein